jgi:hypothetical protein
MQYPPPDFKCPHEHACPYLDFLSTTWVLGEYRRGQDDYQEYLEIIDRFDESLSEKEKRIRLLEKENAELKANLKMLHQRQFKPNKKNDAANSPKPVQGNSPLNQPEKKKWGAPLGHPGWRRPMPQHIDHIIPVPAPTICPYCQKHGLTPTQQLREHIQEDIVLDPRTVVTRYLHEQAFCPTCNRLVVQAGENEILNAPIGPVAKSVAIYLRYGIGISYRKTTELFRELFGLKFVAASAVGFDRKASACGTPIHEDLREKIRNCDVVHADETSWRNNGVGHYAWFAGNEKLAFFHIDRHRSANVAKAIFGEHFEGTLVRDRYAAYNGIGSQWQSCLSHIITKAKEIKREHELLAKTERETLTDRFCEQVVAFFKDACSTGAKLKSEDIPWPAAEGIEKRLVKRLCNICKKPLAFKPAETLRAYLAGADQKYLFTFLRHPGVPPTNNHAEQSIRHLVIFRKTSFGTRSENGLKAHSVLPSLVQTARRQGLHPRQFLQTLLTASTPDAQAALYHNSS